MSLSASSAFRRSSAALDVPADSAAGSVFCMPSVTATPSQCRDPPHGDPGRTQAGRGTSGRRSARAAGLLLRSSLLRGGLRRGLALGPTTLLGGRLLLRGAGLSLSLLGRILRSARGRLSVARRRLVGRSRGTAGGR